MSSVRLAFQQWLHGYDYTCDPVDGLGQDQVVLRPAVLYGDPGPQCPVVVGYNPSRRITVRDLHQRNLTGAQYKHLLSQGGQFEPFYSAVTGKPLYIPGTCPRLDAHSRIQYFIHELIERHGGVIVANYYTYPAGTARKMKALLRRRDIAAWFPAKISGPIPELLRLANQQRPICLGQASEGLCRDLIGAVTPMRHPSRRADPNRFYPNRLTWKQAVASVLTS